MVARRQFIYGLFAASAAAGGWACGGNGEEPPEALVTPPADLPGSVKKALSDLDPIVASRLLTHVPERDLNLVLGFMQSAATNFQLRGDMPLQIDGRKGQQLGTEAQSQIILNKQYGVVPLRDRAVLVAFTALDKKVNPSDVTELVRLVATLLPQVDSFFGNIYPIDWLHMQLYAQGDLNYTKGHNIVLTRAATANRSIITHELGHLYNGTSATITPLFLVEGLPELIAKHLTGIETYALLVPQGQVHMSISIQSVSSRDDYNAESANGFRFLEQVVKTLGMQAVMEAVQETYKSLYAPGVALLQALNKRANGRAFEELCVKWIADFNKFESALR